MAAGCGGDDEESGTQTLRFQRATEPGPDVFTAATDVRGDAEVRLAVGKGPFGGTGSDLVCDRELLIRSLQARPDRLSEWARVVGVEDSPDAVAAYIRKLKPATLTRDTRVTNHRFTDGKAVGYHAILQAGTAVLVDEQGVPRVRCRCGNPLKPPEEIAEVECIGCPPNYRPPPPCEPASRCIRTYPKPPPVRGAGNPTITPAARELAPGERPRFFIRGFPPGAAIGVAVTGPDGERQVGTIVTATDSRTSSVTLDDRGSGEMELDTATTNPGSYRVVVTDDVSGASAETTFTVSGGSGGETPDTGSGGTTPPSGAPGPGPTGGETSDLPACGPGVPTPCRRGDGSVMP